MEPLKAMYPVCTLIKSDGTRCGSPALTGMNFCFHHIGGRVPTPKPETRRVNTPLKLAYPSCHEAIQHNLFLVMQALSEGKIDNATAITYNRLLRSCQLNLHRWQSSQSKLNQDEVEQQMMPCAPEPAPEPVLSPASNGCHPERSATGVPSEQSLLDGARKREVEGPAFCESATEPSVSSADSVVKNENETPGELNAEPRSLDPDPPMEFKPLLTRGEEQDLKLAQMKNQIEEEQAKARGELPAIESA